MIYMIQVPQENRPAFILNGFLGLQEAVQLAKKSLELFALPAVEIVDMETQLITLTLTKDGETRKTETI